MKVFVTGGTGYIGTQLIRHLIRNDDEVVALYRNTPPTIKSKQIQWTIGTLEDRDALSKAMRGCEGVYHVAGLAGLWHADPNAFFDLNVKGTISVLQAAQQAAVQKLVFTSTAAVMSYSIHTPIMEEDPLLEPYDEDYPASKAMAEQEVIKAAKQGLHTVVVNPPRVYGPGKSLRGTDPVNTLLRNILRRSYYMVPGNGSFQGNFVFIDDLVAGHRLAMQKGRSGERYILGGENHSFNSFYAIAQEILGKKHTRITVPKWLMNAAAELSELWTSVSGNAPAVTTAIVNKLYSNRLLSCEKAVRELGYTITPLEEGIRRTLESFEKNHSYETAIR